MSLTVVITGAAGRIAYALIPLICGGKVFGAETRIRLRLLDVQFAADKLDGIAMEIDDCNYPLLDMPVVSTLSPEEAFKDVDVAILLGGFPRLQGMERKELITKNAAGMREQAQALERFAKPSIKVLVVANPANTNCLVAMKSAPKIPPENFTALTRLDEERLRGFVLQQAKGKGMAVKPDQVSDLFIWGNHSATQVPHVDAGILQGPDGTVTSVLSLFDTAQIDALTQRVQNRGAAIIQKQQASSGMSAAEAIAAHLRDWLYAPIGKTFSMAVLSNGNPYGVPDGLVYSFPMRSCGAGVVEMVRDISICPRIGAMLSTSAAELQAEIRDAETLVGDLTIPNKSKL